MIDLRCGNCLDVLKTLDAESIDSIVTDPPYGISFMGKKWDYDVPTVEMWQECLRVLKPGGHLLAFAGTRTQHRMAVNIEDAGFEIRDLIMWHYATGFPKSANISKNIDKAAGVERECTRSGTVQRDGYGEDWDTGSSESRPRYDAPATAAAKQWQGWGTALKPATEILTLARKPFKGTVAANVMEHGTGALNVDGCRIATDEAITNHSRGADSAVSKGKYGDSSAQETHQTEGQSLGRFPANLLHDGSDEVLELFPNTKSGKMAAGTQRAAQDEPGSVCFGTYGGPATSTDTRGDSGSAARFFYCSKCSKKDRDGSSHPTMKPTDLMRYLCRLITPPGGVVLDPFMGSGSTGKAAKCEGFDFIGIELDAEYVEIARRRIDAIEDANG